MIKELLYGKNMNTVCNIVIGLLLALYIFYPDIFSDANYKKLVVLGLYLNLWRKK